MWWVQGAGRGWDEVERYGSGGRGDCRVQVSWWVRRASAAGAARFTRE